MELSTKNEPTLAFYSKSKHDREQQLFTLIHPFDDAGDILEKKTGALITNRSNE